MLAPQPIAKGEKCAAINGPSARHLHCTRQARHHTHEFAAHTRLALCTQHYEMIEHRRRLGDPNALLLSWHERA